MINITKYSSRDMDVNSYILAKENQALVIDPGFNGEAIIRHCQSHDLKLNVCLLTHGHIDHIRDLKMLLEEYDLKIYIYGEEAEFLYNPNLNLSTMFKKEFILDKNIEIHKVEDQETIDFVKEKLKVIHLPGHTRGSMGIIYNQHFFSGDTLFFDSIGRTDLPTGNGGKIFTSLKKIKVSLSKNTVVYPGHGKGGRLAEILQVNPYFNNLN